MTQTDNQIAHVFSWWWKFKSKVADAWFFITDLKHRYKHGCSERELYALDYHASKWLVKRLTAMKEYEENNKENEGCEDCEHAHKEWIVELDKMIAAFNLIIWNNEWHPEDPNFHSIDIKDNPDAKRVYDEGMESFKAHFQDLWI